MPIESKSNQFKPVLLGDNLIAKIYDGSNLVFDQETFPPVWVGNYSPNNVNFYALTFNDNLFVALGTKDINNTPNYFIYTSSDGFVWTKRFETQRQLFSVAGYNGFIVTAARTGPIPTYFYSSNGIDWTESFYFPDDAVICFDNYNNPTGTLTNDIPSTLTRTGNMFAVLGSDDYFPRLVFSYNGLSNFWGVPCNVTAYNGATSTAGSSLFAGNYTTKPIIYDPSTNSVGVFGNPGFFGQTAAQFYFSQIGNNGFVSWTRRGVIAGSLNFTPKGYAANGSQIAVIGSQQIIGTVDGGNNWVLAANEPPSPVTWQCVTYGNGVFMAAGEGDYVAYSPDAVNWFYIPVFSMTGDALPCFSANAIAYGKNRYVIVGDGCISVGLTVGNANITAPSVPRNLSATPAGGGAFLLWDSPTTAGSGTLNDYVVQYSSNSGNTWTTYADGMSTNTYVSLSGLNNGTSYLFRVAAVNIFFQTNLQGLYATTTTSLTIGVPSAPTDLVVTTPSTGTAGLSWTAPADNGAAITDYVIQYSTNGTSWLTFSDGISTNTSVSVTGLTNNTNYFFRVAAKNSRGTGPYVTSTATLIGALPTAPQYVSVTALGVNPPGTGNVGSYCYILVSWNQPVSTGSKPITAYRIKRYDANSNLIETITTANNTVRSFYSAIGTVGQRYKYTVAALTDFGVGAESPFTSAIYPYAAPYAPTNVVATTPSAKTVRLTWNVSANDGGDPAGVRGYQISAAKVVSSGNLSWFDPQNWTGTVVFDANNTAPGATTAGATITDTSSQYLLPGESYVFRVRGVNYADPGFDWGGSSDVFTAINFSDQTTTTAIETEPLSPSLSLAGTGSGVVSLTWSPRYTSTYSGINPITNYTLQYYNLSTGAGWTTHSTPPATTTSASITGLTNGHTYNFRISATNLFGTSGYGLVAAVPAPPPQNAPQELIVAYQQTRQYYSDEFGTLEKSAIAVYFNSATDTLSYITSNEVELSTDNGVTWQNVSVYQGGTTGSANNKGSLVTALGSCQTTINNVYGPSNPPTSVPQFLFRAASINSSGTGPRATTTIPFTPDFRPKTGRRINASLNSFSNGIASVNIDFDISNSPWVYGGAFYPEVPNYSVQYRVIGTNNWTTFTGLINNRQATNSFIYPKFATINVPPGNYEARVAGVNNFGTGFYNHAFFSVSSTGVIGYVSGIPNVGQMECSSGNSSLELFWRGSSNATNYRILIRPYNQTGFAGYTEGYYTVATIANNVFSYTINFSSLPTAIQNALPVGTAIEVVVLPVSSAIEGPRAAMLAYRLEKDLPVPNASDLIGKTLFTTTSCASPQTNCTLIGSYYKTTPVNTYKVPGFSAAGSFLYNDNPYNVLDGVDMVVYKTEIISGTTYTYAVLNTARFNSTPNPTNWAELSYYIFGTGGPAAGQSSCKVGFRYLHAHNAIKGRQVILTLSSNGQISS